LKTDGTYQDMGIEADCIKTVEEATKGLGGLDIIISNAVSLTFSGLAITILSSLTFALGLDTLQHVR